MEHFIDLLKNRRSIRKYLPRPVEEEKIQLLMQAALMSPAGKRLNPWEFVVVTDRRRLDLLAAMKPANAQMLLQAPLGVVICADDTISHTWAYDAAIAAHNILLTAADLGLGACWVQCEGYEQSDGLTSEAYVRQLFDIPQHLRVICVLSIGYKDEERRPYDTEKLPYQKVHYEKF